MSRAAPGRPKQAAAPSGAEAGLNTPSRRVVPAEGLRPWPQRGLQGRSMHPSTEGQA